jgi:hypothetical protein
MTHRIRLIVLAAGTALAALASPSIALAQTKLIGTVADPARISLTTEAGVAVRDLPAGAYTIEVRDESIQHNFHLSGPGIDVRTEVETTGVVTWNVTFQDKARYTFVCDPHNTTMRGSFTIGGGPPTPPPPPPPQMLNATVGANGAVTLRTHHGGRAGENKKTGVSFRGTQTWRVTLRKGKVYRYFSDRQRKRASFRAT